MVIRTFLQSGMGVAQTLLLFMHILQAVTNARLRGGFALANLPFAFILASQDDAWHRSFAYICTIEADHEILSH